MHCNSAIRGHFLFVWLFSVQIFSSFWENLPYFPLVEKHFLFFAQALNCWIPAGKGKCRIGMRMWGYMRIQRYEDIFMMIFWWYELINLNWKWDKSEEIPILKMPLNVKVAMLAGDRVPNKELPSILMSKRWITCIARFVVGQLCLQSLNPFAEVPVHYCATINRTGGMWKQEEEKF